MLKMKKVLFQVMLLLALTSALVACGRKVPEALEVPGMEKPGADAAGGAEGGPVAGTPGAAGAPGAGEAPGAAEGGAAGTPGAGEAPGAAEGGAAGTPAAGEAPGAAEGGAAGTPAAGNNIVPAFKFTNSGATDICQLYLSPVSEPTNWGPDQLQGAKLTAGGEFTLKNIPAGSYDVKAVDCNGKETTFNPIDIKN